MVAVAFGRWSLTRGSDYRDMTGKVPMFCRIRGGRIWEVVAYVGSTVLTTTFDQRRFIKNPTNKNVMSVKRRCETACISPRVQIFSETDVFVKKVRLQQKET